METEEEWITAPWIPISENILFALISAMGIVANTIVIVVICVWEKSRANRSVPQILVVHLAVADLLLLLTLPLSMPVIQGASGWWYGYFMCKLVKGMEHLSYHASISFLTVMSLDRLLATVYLIETRVYRTRKNAIRVTAFVWLVCILMAVPPMVFALTVGADGSEQCVVHFPGAQGMLSEDDIDRLFNLSSGDSEFMLADNYTAYSGGYSASGDNNSGVLPDYDDDYGDERINEIRCHEITHRDSAMYKAYELFNFVIFYLAPVILIVLSYSAILHTASRRVKRIRQNQASSNQAIIVVAVLVTAFLVSWSPYLIWRVLLLPPGVQVSQRWHCNVINTILVFLAYSNSAINPILYSLSSLNFRKKMFASYKFITRGGNRRTLAHHKAAPCSGMPKTSGVDDPSKKYESRSVSTMLCHSTKSVSKQNSRIEGYTYHADEDDEYNHIGTRSGSRLNSQQQSDQKVNRFNLSSQTSSNTSQSKNIGNTSLV